MRDQITELNPQFVQWFRKIIKDQLLKWANTLLERDLRCSDIMLLRSDGFGLGETGCSTRLEVDVWSCYDCKFILAEDLFTELHYILDLMLDLDLCCCDSSALFLQRMQCLYQPSKVGGKSICMFEIWLQKLFLLFDNHIYYYNFITNPALL